MRSKSLCRSGADRDDWSRVDARSAVPQYANRRSRRRLSRHQGPGSVSVARRRHVGGHGDLGRGSRTRSRSRIWNRFRSGSSSRPPADALQLRQVLGAVAEGRPLLLPQERWPAEPERAVYPEGHRRQGRGAASIPTRWSADGTVPLGAFAPSKDGKLAAYGRRSAAAPTGRSCNVMDLTTRKLLPDKVEWVKVSGVAWRGNGFYYSRYPAPAKGKELSSANENHQVFYHRIGHPQAQDELVFEDPTNPQRFHTVRRPRTSASPSSTSPIAAPASRATPLFVRTCRQPGAKFMPLIPEINDDTYGVRRKRPRRAAGVRPTARRPNGRVVRIDPRHPAAANWKTMIAEKSDPSRAGTCGGEDLRDLHEGRGVASSRLQPRRQVRERESQLPGLGSASGFGGNMDDKFIFYTFTSFTYPAVHLPLRHRHAARARCSVRRRFPDFDANRVRDQAGLRHQQGRREGADVPGAQEGPRARRQQPDADVRLRRLQHRHHARLQLAADRAARKGRRLRERQPARRGRIR